MNNILTKYKDRIPIIIKNNGAKYLIKRESTVGEFMCIIRKRIIIDSKKAIFIFVGKGTLIPMNMTMGEIYEAHRDDDLVLYVTYKLENTFG